MLDNDYSRIRNSLDKLPAAMVGMSIVLSASAALACDYTLDAYPPETWPNAEQVQDFPANGIFLLGDPADDYWKSADHQPELVKIERLSTLLKSPNSWPPYEVWTADGGLREDVTYRSDACSSASAECAITVGPPDRQAPPKPIIEDVRVTLIRNGAPAGPVDCPEIDDMEFTVTGFDDRTPSEHLIAIAYFGDTPDAARNAPEASYAWKPEASGDSILENHFGLGTSHDHERDGEHFRQENYCFAVALIDRAGNESERSEPRCIDTIDPNHPDVVEANSSRAACSTSGLAGPSRSAIVVVLLLLSVLLLGFRRGT